MQSVYEEFMGVGMKDMLLWNQKIEKEQIVTSLAAHPCLPFYLSTNIHGKIYLWRFGQSNALAEFSFNKIDSKAAAPEHITRVRFDDTGSKFGATAANGRFSVWTFRYRPHLSASHALPAYEVCRLLVKHRFSLLLCRASPFTTSTRTTSCS